MTFNEKLQELATNGGRLPYIYGTEAEADHIMNQIYKGTEFPMVVHFTGITGRFLPTPQAREERRVSLAFVDLMRFREFTAGAVETKVDGLRAQAQAFLSRLNADGYFEPVEEVAYSVLFDDDSANLVVLLLEFDLLEARGRCI